MQILAEKYRKRTEKNIKSTHGSAFYAYLHMCYSNQCACSQLVPMPQSAMSGTVR